MRSILDAAADRALTTRGPEIVGGLLGALVAALVLIWVGRRVEHPDGEDCKALVTAPGRLIG